jgi:formylglycine-generating enzyme required for sulfatase activity
MAISAALARPINQNPLMTWVPLPGYGVEISNLPVAWTDYADFAEATARPNPHCAEGPGAPLTCISASEAAAYADWVSLKYGGKYRLPKEDELRELVNLSRTNNVYVVTGEWGSELHALSEWLYESAGNGLHRIAHCSWLLAPGTIVCQAALSDHGYSFVTFRLVRSQGSVSK